METKALEDIVRAARPDDDRETLPDRFRGVLLGLAVGNALGVPVEGQSAHAIRRRFRGGVTEIDAGERDRPWDDDVAQAAILAQVLVESDELDPEVFAARLATWARDSGRGIGVLTQSVMDELDRGRESHEAARLAWERNPMSNAGNGAVMRCPPVALRYPRSGVDLVRTARTSALVTHYDARCEWSTAATAVALATCLSGRPVPVDQLADAVDGLGGEGWLADSTEQVGEAIRTVEGASLKALELDNPVDMGYTLKAMQVGLWCTTQVGGFEQIVVDVINEGGDTDTNGAVAGAVMGALNGASNIPERWLDNISDGNGLTQLADRLFEKTMASG
ncbi:MAG: ADP-ribosylglycohydrolase family protein [Actinomycetota bacterium]